MRSRRAYDRRASYIGAAPQMEPKKPKRGMYRSIQITLFFLVLFVLVVGTSCTANPHLYGGRGLVVFLPASTTPSSILRRLEQFRTVKYYFCVLNQNFFKKRVDNQPTAGVEYCQTSERA